ncbi:hypothetical protein SUGI_1152040 [Cryptomeria japonica]|nr:hypothetical protein SUGI_1152040 [Cryptomeria japonica]
MADGMAVGYIPKSNVQQKEQIQCTVGNVDDAIILEEREIVEAMKMCYEILKVRGWPKNNNILPSRGMEGEHIMCQRRGHMDLCLEEISNAKSDFYFENKIGEGGFGVVFKGILPDGKMVVVKQMFSKSTQGNREFLNEVAMISVVQHTNLVKLYGCCIEGKQLLLLYEYVVFE